MAKLKILLPYIFGLMSLIISFGLVSQAKPAQVERLPSPTPTATPLPKPEPFPGARRLARCQAVSQPRFFFYMPTHTAETEKALILSGTVYASDLTPLPGALVEIWPGNFSQAKHFSYPPLLVEGRLTDEAGHYDFATTQLTRSERSYLHYKITYRDYCPLFIDLHLVLEPRPKPAKHTVANVEITGLVLRGPVDMVLPVPPPKP
jgi:hypothetical protein